MTIKKPTRCPLALVLLCVAGLGLATTAAAEADKKTAQQRETARRLQQIQQEKTKLEQETGELKAKVDEQAKALTQTKARAKREVETLQKENGELTEKLKAAEEKVAALGTQLADTTTVLRRRELEKNQLEGIANEQIQIIGRQARSVDSCSARNAKLYDYSAELLSRFKVDGNRAGDPLTGLGQVDAFNVYQGYRDKFDALRLDPPRISQ